MNFEITPVSTATALGMFLSTSFFAVAMSTSLSAMPALTLPPLKKNEPLGRASQSGTSPSHLIRQWRSMFDKAHKIGPFITGLGAMSWLLVAAILPAGKTKPRLLYLTGALLSGGVIPFTVTTMRTQIKTLMERSEVAASGQLLEEEVVLDGNLEVQPTAEVIREWARLNVFRGMLPLAGLACVISANL